jgi:hypothetical protein
MAFQIADDINDIQQDLLRSCATNIAITVGEEHARMLFNQEIVLYVKLLEEVGLDSPELLALTQL